MSEHDDQAGAGEVRFDEREVEVLRDIVTGWVNEQFILPPFPPELTSVIEKLNIADQIQVPATTPAPRNLQNIEAPANQ
jgi:hypothetical protein